MLKRLFLAVLLAGFSSIAWSQDFALDLGCCSQPLTGAPIAVDENGGGTFGYFNSLNTQITELSFDINVGTGFDDSHLICKAFDYFNCQTPNFNSETGILTLEFLAPNAPETGTRADDGPLSTDTESGEGEGIPTLLAGCGLGSGLQDPDTGFSTVSNPHGDGTLPCSYKGHFEVSFNTFLDGQFNPAKCVFECSEGNPQTSGAWTPGTTAALATVNFQALPEPSSVVWLAASLLLIGGIARRRARRRA